MSTAESDQSLLRDRELQERLRSISRGLDQANRGEGRPMRQFVEELAQEHGISLK